MELVVLQLVVLLCLVLLNTRTVAQVREQERARLNTAKASQQVAGAIHVAVATLTERYNLRDQLVQQRRLLERSKAQVIEGSQRYATDLAFEEMLQNCQQQAAQVEMVETAISDATRNIETFAAQWQALAAKDRN